MIKLSTVLEEICANNPILMQGLSHGLLNLTQVAKWIKPLIEVRAKKEVSLPSILMGLSRLQAHYKMIAPQEARIKIKNIALFPDLVTLTYPFNTTINKSLVQLYLLKQKDNFYIASSQTLTELTLIVDRSKEKLISERFKIKPIFRKENLTAVSLNFDESYVQDVGFIYSIIQSLTLQYINIWELSSTYTHLILYLGQKDVQMAVDTLLMKFGTSLEQHTL